MGTRAAGRADGPAARERAGPRLRASVGGAVVLLLIAGAAAVLSHTLNAPGGSRAIPDPGPGVGATGAAMPAGAGSGSVRILVHVLGAVAVPGLYELHDGERILDAVAAAGGFTEEADRSALNLARAVGDGEQIHVPAVGEEPRPPSDPPGGAVNLNTADAAELETLPGVGPELAGRIVDWRTRNGRFASVDELLQVTGIGAKTLSGLAELVTT